MSGLHACNSDPTLQIRIGAGETVQRPFRVWTAGETSAPVSGIFRLEWDYTLVDDRAYDAPTFQTVSPSFSVR
ncbi:MAG: hypothetical protein ACO1Q7_16800 [Gemmatimonas sp.]